MKKSVLFSFVLVMFLFASLSTVMAESNFSETEMVNNAYTCLNEKIDEKTCEKMSIGELIFSTMATGACEDELRDAAETADEELECWPNGNCDLKTTAQAMIALGIDDDESERIIDWFNERRTVPRDVEWFLEIDTPNASICTISYTGNSYTTNILENKKFDSNAGNCLTPSDSGFWLRVQPSCLETEFQISCDEDFVTTLLFSEIGSETIHVSRDVTSAPYDGTSIEKISSFCFREGNECDYDGTLWAGIALSEVDYDLLPFVPYLITAKNSNKDVFSQPLLFMLTGYDNYRIDILDRQVNEQYWLGTDRRWFSTALALFPFTGLDFEEKTNAIEWLSELQGDDGCWDEGNIVSNSFLLSSIWPRYWTGSGGPDGPSTTPTTPDNDCVDLGNYCESAFDRDDDFMDEYYCAGGARMKCYSTPSVTKTCASEYPGSDICAYDEICPTNNKEVGGETCCVGSPCQKKETPIPTEPEENVCETVAQGYCAFSCSSGDVEDDLYSLDCDAISSGDICCVGEGDGKESNYLWLWILFAIIILLVIAIIYRDKIREEILKMKSKKDEGLGGQGDRFRSSQMRPGIQRPQMRQRRIIPNARPTRPGMQRPVASPGTRPVVQRPGVRPQSGTRPQPGQRPRQKSPEELNDVLRKLKDMSK